MLTVRSEIGPYRRPVTALFRVAKNNHRRCEEKREHENHIKR